MNAPLQHPRWRQYEPAVLTLIPGVDPAQVEMRARLMLIRDRASATMKYCCDAAWPIMAHVQSLANETAFGSASLEELTQVRWVLVKLVSNASVIEDLFGGGGGARG